MESVGQLGVFNLVGRGVTANPTEHVDRIGPVDVARIAASEPVLPSPIVALLLFGRHLAGAVGVVLVVVPVTDVALPHGSSLSLTSSSLLGSGHERLIRLPARQPNRVMRVATGSHIGLSYTNNIILIYLCQYYYVWLTYSQVESILIEDRIR